MGAQPAGAGLVHITNLNAEGTHGEQVAEIRGIPQSRERQSPDWRLSNRQSGDWRSQGEGTSRTFGRTGMRPWKYCSILILVLALGALGCGSSSSSTTITLVISPTQASVITNTTLQIAPLVTGTTDTAV